MHTSSENICKLILLYTPSLNAILIKLTVNKKCKNVPNLSTEINVHAYYSSYNKYYLLQTG